MRFASDIEDLVYFDYLEIDYNAYQERIRFFEKHKKQILVLPYEMRLELSLDYVNALFEVGDYYAFLRHVDKLLEIVVMDNLYDLNGVDIYQELLFKKASAYYNILDYIRAEHVFSELIKINPKEDLYKQAFIKNRADKLRYDGQRTGGMIIAIFMMTGCIIGIELLIIRPFYSDLTSSIELLRNITFGLGLTLLVLKELGVRLRSRQLLHKIIKEKR